MAADMDRGGCFCILGMNAVKDNSDLVTTYIEECEGDGSDGYGGSTSKGDYEEYTYDMYNRDTMIMSGAVWSSVSVALVVTTALLLIAV